MRPLTIALMLATACKPSAQSGALKVGQITVSESGLAGVLGRVLEHFACTNGTIHGFDAESGMLRLLVQRGLPEAFLARIFDSYRSSTSESGSNVWNTAPGGTSRGEPTTMFLRGLCLNPIRPRPPASSAQVRPLRLPGASDPRLPLGPAGLRVQRRVPPHLADRHPAEGPESRRAAHPA